MPNTAIPPYDPKVGPVITPAMWTPEMLAAPLTEDLLKNQTDPAGFTNARRATRETPTPATVVTEYAGTIYSTEPLNPVTLSSDADASGMRAQLIRLGMALTYEPIESVLGGGSQHYEWYGETRRQWMIGSLNVGLLCLRYAVTLVDLADQQTIAELKAAGMLA